MTRGKTYDSTEGEGVGLWQQAQLAASGLRAVENSQVAELPSGYGTPNLVLPRLGQGAFRVMITNAFDRRCAVTGERTLPVLEAAHIKPFNLVQRHDLSNGLLLRSDLHTLFDRGYVTVSEDLRVEVSRRLREEFENGRDYYKYHGHVLASVPPLPDERPAPSFLQWHNNRVFLG